MASSNFSASLGGGLITVNNGAATLNIDPASGAISGSFTGTIAMGAALARAGVGFSGQLAVSIVNGAIQASGNNDTLTLLGQTFTASFAFLEDSHGFELNIAGLGFSLGGVLSVAGASGTLSVNSAGISGSTTGSVSSTLAGLGGTLGVAFVPGKLLVSGTADTLAFGDQSLAGNFTFSSVGRNLQLDITNLTASLGGGLVTLGGASPNVGATASLTVNNGQVSGSFNGYLAAGTAGGVAFSGAVRASVTPTAITVSGNDDTLTIGGQTITGAFAFAEDATTHVEQLTVRNVSFGLGGVLSVSNVNGNVDVGSTGLTGAVTGTLNQSLAGLTANAFGIQFAPGSLQISASGAQLSLGGSSLSGDFAFVQNANGLQLSSSNFSADLGGGLVAVSGGSGSLNVNHGQITGTFTGNVSAGGAMTGGAGFSGAVSVTVLANGITALGTSDTLTVGTFALTTDFNFRDDANGLELAVGNLNFSLGNAISIANASGMLHVTPAGIGGFAAGTVASNFSGLSISGQLGVAFANGSVTVGGTHDTLQAGGQTVSGDFYLYPGFGGHPSEFHQLLGLPRRRVGRHLARFGYS